MWVIRCDQTLINLAHVITVYTEGVSVSAQLQDRHVELYWNPNDESLVRCVYAEIIAAIKNGDVCFNMCERKWVADITQIRLTLD
jgi:hypothetical protein